MNDAIEPGAVPFMSAPHVALMNARLEASAVVRQACAELSADATIGYRLRDEDTGALVSWQMRFSRRDGIRFALGEPDSPSDMTLVTGYWKMLDAVKAQRRNEPADPGIQVEGDAAVFARVGPVFALAQSVATVPVIFPERGAAATP